MNDEYKDIDLDQPQNGQYCEMIIVSRFRGWYMPECRKWPWMMDDDYAPTSEVTEWKECNKKDDDELL